MLLVLVSQAGVFAGRDVLWFIDNTSVLGSLIKGRSSDPVVHIMCEAIHLLFFQAHIMTYFEWVESKANWSDGVSRDLDDCPWAAARGFQVAVVAEPACASSSLDALLADLVSFPGIWEVAGAARSVLRVAFGT